MGFRSGNRKRKWASEVVTGKVFGSQICNQKFLLLFCFPFNQKLVFTYQVYARIHCNKVSGGMGDKTKDFFQFQI